MSRAGVPAGAVLAPLIGKTWACRVAFCDRHDMKMAMRSLTATIILLGLLSPAGAQEPDEAIVLLVVPFSENDEGVRYAKERVRLDKVVVDTSRESGRYRPQAAPGELAFIKDFFECEVEGFPACLAKAGQQARAEQVFWGSVNQASTNSRSPTA